MINTVPLHYQTRKLTTLVENQTTYASEYAELHVFETYKACNDIQLSFDSTVIASMLTGKKVMHFDNANPFYFTPGESLVIPKNTNISIDFPEASLDSPTQCLGLVIEQNKIDEVVYNFNEITLIERENNNWCLNKNISHLNNNVEINILINRLSNTFINNAKTKDALLNLMIQELVIRLLQSKARKLILNNSEELYSDTRIGYAVSYIKENLTNNDLNLEKISKQACMSKSHFLKKFKNTLGITPTDYINTEKIKMAKKMLKNNPNENICNIAYKVGFNNVSYFNRIFKKYQLLTPQQYKLSLKK